MGRMVDVDDLVGPSEIAALTGCTLSNAYALTRRAGFPDPVVRLGKIARLWLLPEVDEWLSTHRLPTEHGTRGKYVSGCRCGACKTAHALYMRDYYRRKAVA